MMHRLLPLALAALAAPSFARQAGSWAPEERPPRDFVYYDYVEDGELRGGMVAIDPNDPLLATIEPLERSAPSSAVTLVDNGPSSNRIDIVFVGDGYTSVELGAYAAHVDSVYPVFFATPPLDAYASYFNVHRVDVVSSESGVDNDPTQGISRNTAMDMGYWCGGTERLLCINTGKANLQAANARAVDQILAVANSTKYGGAGYNDLGTLAGNNGSSIEIALHEFGHSFPGLADEYETGGPATWPGGEPTEPNVSTYDAAGLAANQKKWHLWLGRPNVDAFEGAKYSQFGIYRPTVDSKMRSLGRPFQAVNSEQFVRELYRTIDPIDDATPAGVYTFDDVLSVTPMQPVFHSLDVQWMVEGIPIPGATSNTLDLKALALPDGVYRISVLVVDNTSIVRNESYRTNRMTSSRTWTAISTRRYLLAPGIKGKVTY